MPRRYLFFFQAEDGIRDHCVTGVQTCALPICEELPAAPHDEGADVGSFFRVANRFAELDPDLQIGRASCRERVAILALTVRVIKKRQREAHVVASAREGVSEKGMWTLMARTVT